jgi:plastocyanin
MNRLVCSLGLAAGLLGSSVSLAVPATALAASAKIHVVAIRGYAFIPRALVVNPGDKVIWVNRDADQHSIVGDAPASTLLRSHALGSGARYRITISRSGKLRYHCGYHAFMTGTIQVRVHSTR